MRRTMWLTAAGIVFTCRSGHAQIVNVWPGVAPGSETWTQKERTVEMFLAWAQDDAVALDRVVRFHHALTAAGYKPEVHIFSAGGHGFGMRNQGASSDHWIEAFYYWVQAQGLTTP